MLDDVSSCVQTDATTANNVRTCSVLWEGFDPYDSVNLQLPLCFQHINALLSPWRPYVMRARGPNKVGRAVPTDPTLLRYVSEITEQKKCWEFLTQTFDQFITLQQLPVTPSNMQEGVQTDATCNTQQYWNNVG